MTREEQRYLRELKKPFEAACRSVEKLAEELGV